MNGWVWLTPFVGAFIGWLANYIAITMLFRPREPKRLFGWSLQGVVPKRRHDLALKIGEVVETELLKWEDILNAIHTEELPGHLAAVLESRIDRFFREKLFRGDFLYSKLFSREAVQRAKRALITELVNLFPIEVDAAIEQLVENVHLGEIVATRVEQFECEQLEEVVCRVASTELHWVMYLGGVLGFLIGLLQVLFTWMLRP